jgi:GNAT superfamily N-acetyltransferase
MGFLTMSVPSLPQPTDIATALSPISEADIRDAYLAAPKLGIDDGNTVLLLQLLLRTTDGNKVNCLISFHTEQGEPILDRDLERWLCDNKRLLGRSGRSKVAYRVKFYVRRNFREKGFAQYILAREEELFRRWGAKEIQVTAMDDGRWVWTREKFGYRIPIDEFEFLQQRYSEWQRETGVTDVERAVALADFPKEFLLSAARSLSLYKDL